jgi:branched-subunit amino acid ABC-type transport system permease component
MEAKKISTKDLFVHLFAELKVLYDTYVHYVLTTTATQILIIGWFMSGKMPDFVKRPSIVVPLYITIACFMAIEVGLSLYFRQRSSRTADLIRKLDFINNEHFDFKVISIWIVLGMLVAHAILYLFLALIVASF